MDLREVHGSRLRVASKASDVDSLQAYLEGVQRGASRSTRAGQTSGNPRVPV